MGLKNFKPTTPSLRHKVANDYSEITKTSPEKKLSRSIRRSKGRSFGTITVRHRGGGNRKLWREVDFKRFTFDKIATVKAIEYDPNRTAYIALVFYENGLKSYILAPHDLQVGQKLVSSNKKVEAIPGNRMPLKFIPESSFVYNIELNPGRGGQMVKSAGNNAQLLAHDGGFAQVKLPSGEVRNIHEDAMATVGQLSNIEHDSIKLGKAGVRRHMGRRPQVRGSAMNPVDHPHGGGEGCSPIGLKYPKTPWGKRAMGVKTRKKKKQSSRLIIKRRNDK